MERADGKAARDDQRTGLADGARPDAMPNAAGHFCGHGASPTIRLKTHSAKDQRLNYYVYASYVLAA